MSKSIHDFKVKDLAGRERDLSEYKGKVLLVVNTATECGLTPQLAELEKLREELKDEGFEVLGFPSNDFAGQEPREGEKISEFCQVNYGVSFPMFEKMHVKGSKQHELFRFLTNRKENGKVNSTPKWNFQKYLIDKDGKVVDFFYPITKPSASRLKRKVKKLLK